MSDIVERLRNWRTVHLARLHLLMEEAADEMERLRLELSDAGKSNHPEKPDSSTLTDAEREAVAYYLGTGGPYAVHATLSGLLARLSPPAT